MRHGTGPEHPARAAVAEAARDQQRSATSRCSRCSASSSACAPLLFPRSLPGSIVGCVVAAARRHAGALSSRPRGPARRQRRAVGSRQDSSLRPCRSSCCSFCFSRAATAAFVFNSAARCSASGGMSDRLSPGSFAASRAAMIAASFAAHFPTATCRRSLSSTGAARCSGADAGWSGIAGPQTDRGAAQPAS